MREARSLQGDLPVASLTRTLDLLADSAGVIGYRIEGRMGERHRPQLILRVEGVLSLSCQRCLEGISYPLRLENTLEFVVDEEDLTQEEIEDDSRDFLPAVKRFIEIACGFQEKIKRFIGRRFVPDGIGWPSPRAAFSRSAIFSAA